MSTQNIVHSINDEVSEPLNEKPTIPEPVKTKESCFTFKVRLAIASAFVISICLGGLGLYLGLR